MQISIHGDLTNIMRKHLCENKVLCDAVKRYIRYATFNFE